MAPLNPLEPAKLYRRCDPEGLSFSTTAELEDIAEVIGQPRAVEAVRFGIAMDHRGYNIFALGPSGMGKYSLVRKAIEEKAGTQQAPDDWCYVYNFAEPHKPKALRLPPGQGLGLQQALVEFVEELGSALPAAFESEEYRVSRQGIEEEFKATAATGL